MFRRLTVALLALLALVSVPGCVYYNTFYHATAAAREAELLRQSRPPGTEPSAGEMELLERVVEKCGRVIRLHPDSGWADDALVLMGEALYKQSKYETAEDRLTEFVALYPESDLRPTAEYFLAAVLLAKGNAVSAEEILSEVAFADPPSGLSDDALLLIGDARRKRKRYGEAAEAYRDLLDRFPGSERRAETRFVAAENFVDMGRLADAAAELDAVAHERSSRELAFESRIRLADVLVDLGDTDAALAILEELERRTTARNDIDRLLLTRGHTYEAMGNFEEATSTYGTVAFEHERSDAAAEAHYRIGLIHRNHWRDFDEAVASFREAKEQSPRSEVATLATEAVTDIESLREYLSVIDEHEHGPAPADTASAAGQASEPAREDSLGITERERVPSVPDSRATGASETVGRPVAALRDTTATVESDTLGEPVRAHPDSASLAGPPATDDPTPGDALMGPMPAATDPGAAVGPPLLGEWALDDFIGPMSPEWTAASEKVAEVAIARLRVAEIYLFKLGDPAEALPYYESVVREHETSKLAPKAAYAVAWLKEHETDDLEGAVAAYRDLIERFPGTDHALEAGKAVARLTSTGASSEPSDGGAGDVQLDTQEEPFGPPPPPD